MIKTLTFFKPVDAHKWIPALWKQLQKIREARKKDLDEINHRCVDAGDEKTQDQQNPTESTDRHHFPIDQNRHADRYEGPVVAEPQFRRGFPLFLLQHSAILRCQIHL